MLMLFSQMAKSERACIPNLENRFLADAADGGNALSFVLAKGVKKVLWALQSMLINGKKSPPTYLFDRLGGFLRKFLL